MFLSDDFDVDDHIDHAEHEYWTRFMREEFQADYDADQVAAAPPAGE